MGIVYWTTGLSGACKTTIGKLLYEKIKEKLYTILNLKKGSYREYRSISKKQSQSFWKYKENCLNAQRESLKKERSRPLEVYRKRSAKFWPAVNT